MGKQELIKIDGLDELSITVHYLKEHGITIPKYKLMGAKDLVTKEGVVYLIIKKTQIPLLNVTITSVEFATQGAVKLNKQIKSYINEIRDAENGDLAEKSIYGTSVIISVIMLVILVWVIIFRFSNPQF